MNNTLGIPDFVTLFTDKRKRVFSQTETMQLDDVSVELLPGEYGVKVQISALTTPLEYLRLRWQKKLPANARFLGDAWERSYGDLQWQSFNPSRMMPWYFLMNCDGVTAGYGVKVRPGAMVLWSVDPEGVTLWLDLRCGCKGVVLSSRTLHAAEIVSREYSGISAFAGAQDFCKSMCDDPTFAPHPVYGGNNWYYAYGQSSHEEILADCRYIASLCEGLENRPYMVIDDGWEIMHLKPGNSGPWTCGNSKYPDMKKLADEMRRCGVRPGIWFRPLWNIAPEIPRSWLMPERYHTGHQALDPSIPGVVELVKEDIRRISNWGYELIKHDFSTWDMFGIWGRETQAWMGGKAWGEPDWSFADRSRTSAEIVVDFYKAIKEAAGNTLILGCNTIGHLGAGLMQLSRTGDDTSGRAWDRTRKMGVNTLAFRLCQHKAFYDVDADCIGVTGSIDWKQNSQWAELLAKSSTPLFASIKPGVLTDAENADMKRFFAIASKQEIAAEPLDWLDNVTPAKWRFDNAEQEFNWFEAAGCSPDFIGDYSE